MQATSLASSRETTATGACQAVRVVEGFIGIGRAHWSPGHVASELTRALVDSDARWTNHIPLRLVDI